LFWPVSNLITFKVGLLEEPLPHHFASRVQISPTPLLLGLLPTPCTPPAPPFHRPPMTIRRWVLRNPDFLFLPIMQLRSLAPYPIFRNHFVPPILFFGGKVLEFGGTGRYTQFFRHGFSHPGSLRLVLLVACGRDGVCASCFFLCADSAFSTRTFSATSFFSVFSLGQFLDFFFSLLKICSL